MKKTATSKKHFVWFRRDLRLTDNKALFAACKDSDAQVIALYVATPLQWQQHSVAPRQIAFIHAHLKSLAQGLAELGIPLLCHTCDTYEQAVKWVAHLCLEEKNSALFFNTEYELNERRRDQQVVEKLTGKLPVYALDDCLLTPPGMIRTQQGGMYKVFTPFRRTVLKVLSKRDNHSLPQPDRRKASADITLPTPTLFTHRPIESDELFPVGESAAMERLIEFCQYQVGSYAHDRNAPSIDATSCLSPYLAIGVLSARQCFNRLLAEQPDTLLQTDGGAFTWLSELIWREFYHHLIFAFPYLCCYKPFLAWTEQIAWNTKEDNFQAWVEGKTGYPIVDAGMRQLKHTGWMHNRLRMITASFLVKDLQIDWRKGEHYFMSELLDGCFASNNGGWQWCASTGTDASPWFRIFNPTTQGKKFDPKGLFIRRWLPELKNVPDSNIHMPHQWAKQHHIQLDYPEPIVDHDTARKTTLEVFKKARNQI
ncbi:MAG: deoxyribodipyrimidine photo-lyase [Saezia sp.]